MNVLSQPDPQKSLLLKRGKPFSGSDDIMAYFLYYLLLHSSPTPTTVVTTLHIMSTLLKFK